MGEKSLPAAVPNLLRRVRRFVWDSCAIVGISMILFVIGFDASRVTSPSMSPTLQGTSWENGDTVITEKLTYRIRDPRRWEVVTIRTEDRSRVAKRVVGLPGETVQVLPGGKIVVDGEPLTPPPSLGFLDHLPYGNVKDGKKVECGDGYYVLGDLSTDSDDSRFNGPVACKEIVGRTWVIVAPWARVAWVNP